jgi:peptidase M28-like protein
MNTQATAVARNYSRREAVISLLAWLFIALLSALAVMELKPPAPLAAGAPLSNFSAERALVHVRAIAATPHPLGSEANAAVRTYLLAQLSSLGLNPEVFEGIGVTNRRSGVSIGATRDMVGRLPGTASSGAVLLMAHYDSVRFAPGAADDGAGVAAILETIRALRSGSALKNDLMVLFTDGEEAGLLGADAFAAAHPWMKDVGLILNFEARGNQGPALLFETGADNSTLVKATAQYTPHPIGSSLFYSLYKLLPNDTDFSTFRTHHIPGLNFAFGENLDAYHSSLDTPNALSLASLQHHGSYALGLAQHFGQTDLTHLKTSKGDDVFFNWLGGAMMAYSTRWVLPGELLITALLVLTIVLRVRQSKARTSRIVLAALASFVIVLVLPVATGIVSLVLSKLLAGRLIIADSAANSFLLLGYVLLASCFAGWLLAAFRKRLNLQELSLGGLTSAGILSWLVALALPAGSYLLFWPLLLVLIGLLAAAWSNRAEQPGAHALASLAGAAMAILLFAPVAYLVYIFLTLQVITAAALAVLVALFFLIAFPLMNIALPQQQGRSAILVLAIAAIAACSVGVVLSHESGRHPRHDTLLYSMNADSSTAAWISFDRSIDRWTSQFFTQARPQRHPQPDYLAGMERPVLSAPAPAVGVPPPVAEVKADHKDSDVRRIRMNVRSQRQATSFFMTFTQNVRVLSMKVGGREIVPIQSSGLNLSLFGLAPQGADLEFAIQTPGAVSFWLMDQSSGLPVETRPRPGDIVANSTSDMTWVCRRYSW